MKSLFLFVDRHVQILAFPKHTYWSVATNGDGILRFNPGWKRFAHYHKTIRRENPFNSHTLPKAIQIYIHVSLAEGRVEFWHSQTIPINVVTIGDCIIRFDPGWKGFAIHEVWIWFNTNTLIKRVITFIRWVKSRIMAFTDHTNSSSYQWRLHYKIQSQMKKICLLSRNHEVWKPI